MTFLVAVLTGLGVGSGGLYILYLTLIKDIPQAEAQGMNLIFFITATLAAALLNLIKRRISFTCVLLTVPVGILGAIAGSYIASYIKSETLSIMFGVLLVVIGVSGFIKLLKKGKSDA